MAEVGNIDNHYYFYQGSNTLSCFKTDNGISIELMNAVTNQKISFEVDREKMLLLIGLFNDVYVGENVASKDFLNDHYKQLKKRLNG